MRGGGGSLFAVTDGCCLSVCVSSASVEIGGRSAGGRGEGQGGVTLPPLDPLHPLVRSNLPETFPTLSPNPSTLKP